MLRELYTRIEGDPKYLPNTIEENDRLGILLGQIRLLFATRKGEVISEPEYGLNLDDFLFETYVNKEEIQNEIGYQFNTFVSGFSEFDVSFDVQIVESLTSANCVIDVYIDQQKYLGFLI